MAEAQVTFGVRIGDVVVKGPSMSWSEMLEQTRLLQERAFRPETWKAYCVNLPDIGEHADFQSFIMKICADIPIGQPVIHTRPYLESHFEKSDLLLGIETTGENDIQIQIGGGIVDTITTTQIREHGIKTDAGWYVELKTPLNVRSLGFHSLQIHNAVKLRWMDLNWHDDRDRFIWSDVDYPILLFNNRMVIAEGMGGPYVRRSKRLRE